MIFSDERLETWQQAVQLAELVYAGSSSLPSEERFGLTSQIRRAVVSVSAIIAEGAGRGHAWEFIHFLWQAKGSPYEVASFSTLAQHLGFLNSSEHTRVRGRCESAHTLLAGLIRSLNE